MYSSQVSLWRLPPLSEHFKCKILQNPTNPRSFHPRLFVWASNGRYDLCSTFMNDNVMLHDTVGVVYARILHFRGSGAPGSMGLFSHQDAPMAPVCAQWAFICFKTTWLQWYCQVNPASPYLYAAGSTDSSCAAGLILTKSYPCGCIRRIQTCTNAANATR